MQMILDTTELKNVLNSLKVFVEKGFGAYAETCLLSVVDGQVSLAVYNHSTHASVILTPLECDKTDIVVAIPVARMLEVVSHTDSPTVTLNFDKSGHVMIAGGGRKSKVSFLDGDKFPSKKRHLDEGILLDSCDLDLLTNGVLSVSHCAIINDNTPVLAGINIRLFDKQHISFAATDTFRISVNRFDKTHAVDDYSCILSASSLEKMLGVFKKLSPSTPISVFYHENYVGFDNSIVTVIISMLHGNFPQYRTFHEKKPATYIVFNPVEFLSALNYTMVTSDSVVTLTVRNNIVTISTELDGQVGEATVGVQNNGVDTVVKADAKFLKQQVARQVSICGDSENVVMSLGNTVSPIFLSSEQHPMYLSGIMPLSPKKA